MSAEQALSTSRLVAAGTTVAVLVLAALTELVQGAPRVDALALPAGLIGLVSPVIGFRLYEYLRQQGRGGEVERRRSEFVRANLLAFAVTEAAALFGIVAFVLSGKVVALIGVLMHVILVGAMWPSPERLELFVDGDP